MTLLILLIFFSQFKMSANVEALPSPKTIVGTRTHWDDQSQSLYYCDVSGASILRYDYKENKVYSATIDGENIIAFIIPVADTTDEFALGLGRRVAKVRWDGKSPKATLNSIAFEVESDKTDNRFNAAKADPQGRFYGGTMRSEKFDLFEIAAGAVYKHVKGDGTKEVLNNIYVSNGMAWNETNNKCYYIDSCKFDVKEYDWNPSTGDLCEW